MFSVYLNFEFGILKYKMIFKFFFLKLINIVFHVISLVHFCKNKKYINIIYYDIFKIIMTQLT